MKNEKQWLIDNGYLDFAGEEAEPIGKYNKLCINCNIETHSYMSYCSNECLYKELGY